MLKDKDKNVKMSKKLWLELSREKLDKQLDSISDVIEIAWNNFKNAERRLNK